MKQRRMAEPLPRSRPRSQGLLKTTVLPGVRTVIVLKLQPVEQEDTRRSRKNDECPGPGTFPHSPQDRCPQGSAAGVPLLQSRWHLRLAQIVCIRAVAAGNSCVWLTTIQSPCLNRTTGAEC